MKPVEQILEKKWQRSNERKGKTKGRRDYNYARSMFFRKHRPALEMAAY